MLSAPAECRAHCDEIQYSGCRTHTHDDVINVTTQCKPCALEALPAPPASAGQSETTR